MGLWNDLKAFYDEHYSADRLKVVIQVKTADNLAELTQWVTESFSVIENKNLGYQDFSRYSKRTFSEESKSKILNKLPFEGNEDEMILTNHIMDNNSLLIVQQYAFDYERQLKQSVYHIDELVGTEGPGSLYQILKELNWIDSLSTMDSPSYKSAFKFQFLEIGLTDEGLLHTKEVLAIVFGMIDKFRNEWLPNRHTNTFHQFNETCIMSQLDFNQYKVPDQLDLVTEMATNLIYNRKPEMIVKETYSPKIIENIDFSDIEKFAERMTLENCKIFLGGKDLLSKQEIVSGF